MTGISGWQVGCGSNQSVAGKPGGRESHVLRCRAGGKKPKDGLREHPPPHPHTGLQEEKEHPGREGLPSLCFLLLSTLIIFIITVYCLKLGNYKSS